MQIIPVVDLMGGVVVHARRGERDNYRPIESKLCPSAGPVAIVTALLSLHAFAAIYIADLDAIRGTGQHRALVAELHTRFPAVEFWLDAGISDLAGLRRLAAEPCATPVVGSETLSNARALGQLRTLADVVLSLDYKDGLFLGDPALLQDPSLWPPRVLAMNLSRVGAALGPDTELIAALKSRRPDCAVFAAGGVRDAADLRRLRAIGAAGALVATALHSGAITPAALREF